MNRSEREEEILNRYTDFIDEEPYLKSFQFDSESLADGHGDPETAVTRALFAALGDIRDHPSSRVSQTPFTLWTGREGVRFYIGALRGLSSTASAILEASFRRLAGYLGPETAACSHPRPLYRYEYEAIIHYAEKAWAGEEYVTDTGNGAVLVLRFRCARPAALIGRECYGGLTSGALLADGPAPEHPTLFELDAAPPTARPRRPRGPRRPSEPSAQIPLPLDLESE